VVLLVVACGGTARSTKPLLAVGGAADESTSVAGAGAASLGREGGASAGGLGTGGMGAAGVGASAGGVTAGGVGAAGENGDAMAGGASSAAGGEPSVVACEGLGCLAGAELLYRPDREWQHTAADTSSELAEADYEARLGPTWLAKLSSDAQSLDLTPTAGGDTVHGTRDLQRLDRAFFELSLFAGGRFVVQAVEGELRAEYTVYGSGFPIVSSTRGLLVGP